MPHPPCSAHPWTQGLGAGAPSAARAPAPNRQEVAHRVLAQAALNVGVCVAPGATVRAAQRHLPSAGALLLTAGTLVVQSLRLGRVPGGKPESGPSTHPSPPPTRRTSSLPSRPPHQGRSETHIAKVPQDPEQ